MNNDIDDALEALGHIKIRLTKNGLGSFDMGRIETIRSALGNKEYCCVEVLYKISREIENWEEEAKKYKLSKNIQRCHDHMDGLKRALEIVKTSDKYLRPESNCEWMPIETAPKDGTEIIVLYKGKPKPSKWFKPDDSMDVGSEGGWCEAVYCIGGMMWDGVLPFDEQPTMWTPLPKPPRERK